MQGCRVNHSASFNHHHILNPNHHILVYTPTHTPSVNVMLESSIEHIYIEH